MAEVAGELISLGVREVGIVGDGTAGYGEVAGDPKVRLFSLDRQAEAIAHFRQAPGTTVMILDKECATEKGRRRRRRGGAPERYVFIDEEVCEGCGDCLRQSEGCAALYSVDTELGDKRQVQQASCMQDELCLDGECPSFLTVQAKGGTRLRRRRPPALDGIPEPRRRELAEGETLTLFTVGRGGTGVVTVSHLIAWAALLDGLRVYLSNNTGLAQKGGPVEAPIQLARSRQPAFHRLLPGGADVYIGFDLLRAAEASNLRYADPGRTVAVVSTTRLPTAGLNRNPEQRFPDPEGLAETIDACTRKDDNCYLDTSWLAEGLFGDILFANVILLGAAFQSGQLPLRADSLEAVIRLNGKAVEDNLQAFRWGRLAVADPDRVRAAVGAPRPDAASVVARSRRAAWGRPRSAGRARPGPGVPRPVRRRGARGELPHRPSRGVPGQRLGRPLRRGRGAGARGRESRRGERGGEADPGGGPEPAPADDLQGRVRGRPPDRCGGELPPHRGSLRRPGADLPPPASADAAALRRREDPPRPVDPAPHGPALPLPADPGDGSRPLPRHFLPPPGARPDLVVRGRAGRSCCKPSAAASPWRRSSPSPRPRTGSAASSTSRRSRPAGCGIRCGRNWKSCASRSEADRLQGAEAGGPAQGPEQGRSFGLPLPLRFIPELVRG